MAFHIRRLFALIVAEQQRCGPQPAAADIALPPPLPVSAGLAGLSPASGRAALATDAVDAAQALLGLMTRSPTLQSPATAPPGLARSFPDVASPPSPALSASDARSKRRKRAVEMSPAELQHARETNKRSAQQFRERERLRRQEQMTRSDQAS